MSEADEIRTVLALNCGSSSLKLAEPLVEGAADAIGTPEARFSARVQGGASISEAGAIASHAEAAQSVFAVLGKWKTPAPSAIGHRIVHGGPSVRRHCLIDPQVLRALEAARVFAPLHTPAALEVVRIAQLHFDACPHIACLDTAFHHSLPDVARRFPSPRRFRRTALSATDFTACPASRSFANWATTRPTASSLPTSVPAPALQLSKEGDPSIPAWA
jgi:acetate kinase